MATSGMPQQSASGQEASNTGQDSLQEFRQLAQQVQAMAQKFPEFGESAVTILKEIQKAMVQVAGSSQRTPDKPAPPMA